MKLTKKLLALVLACMMLISLASCSRSEKSTDELWADALYSEDAVLGDGSKSVTVKVTAGEKSIVFTVKTDSETLGEAMSEQLLVEGEQGQFGLYVKKVNGIMADFDKDRTYWGISKDGTDLLNGIDSEKIMGGESYEFARKK